MDPITLYAGKGRDALLSKAAGAVWAKLTKNSVNPAFAKAYRKWRDSLAGGDDTMAATTWPAMFGSRHPALGTRISEQTGGAGWVVEQRPGLRLEFVRLFANQ